jgi:hypothetical protein
VEDRRIGDALPFNLASHLRALVCEFVVLRYEHAAHEQDGREQTSLSCPEHGSYTPASSG